MTLGFQSPTASSTRSRSRTSSAAESGATHYQRVGLAGVGQVAAEEPGPPVTSISRLRAGATSGTVGGATAAA